MALMFGILVGIKGEIMSEDLREEWLEDMREEARAEEYHEYKMRNDYDNFLEYYDDEIADLITALNNVKHLHEEYGWDFDVREFEGL